MGRNSISLDDFDEDNFVEIKRQKADVREIVNNNKSFTVKIKQSKIFPTAQHKRALAKDRFGNNKGTKPTSGFYQRRNRKID